MGPFIRSYLRDFCIYGKRCKYCISQNRQDAHRDNQEGWNKGRGLQKLKKPLIDLYDKIIFSKIREAYGGELDYFIGGGALLDIELQRFFYALGIPMYQGYGLHEASPVISSNSTSRHKLGSSGLLVNNMDLKKCAKDGNEVPIGKKV